MGADGHTFFAIIDPSVGNAGALQFLDRVRDAFRSHAAAGGRSNGFHDSLVPAVRRLVASLEKMPHAAFVLEDGGGGGGSSDGGTPGGCTSSKAPLLGKSGSRKEKKKSSRDKLASAAAGDGEDEQHGGTRGLRIDMPAACRWSGAPASPGCGGSSSGRGRCGCAMSRSLASSTPSSAWRCSSPGSRCARASSVFLEMGDD